MRLTGLACSLLLALAASASAGAAPAPRVVSVPGPTDWLAVDSGAAFVLDRQAKQPAVIRVDLATGRRAVVFRTNGFPGDSAWAADGVLGFGVDVPSEPGRTQAIAIPTADPAGGARVVAEAVEGPGPQPCDRLTVDGVTPAGELVVNRFSAPCNARDGTETVTAVGPGGERPLLRQSLEGTGDEPLGNLDEYTTTIAAGPWALSKTGEETVRLVNTATGARRTFRSSLPHARALVNDLQPDGRFVLQEILFRQHGGYVQRARVVSPGDGARGGRVLGTVGTSPRLNALFCGGRLVVSRTKDHRTRILFGEREIARVSTSAQPREACDATHLAVETTDSGATTTRIAVVPLKP
jgi:hypothetical protein